MGPLVCLTNERDVSPDWDAEIEGCDGDSLMIGDTFFTVCPWWDGPMVRERIGRSKYIKEDELAEFDKIESELADQMTHLTEGGLN